jgi:hypothetical protein
VNLHCFPAFLSIPPQQFKLVLDSIIWAFKHTMRNVADTGLNILIQLLQVREIAQSLIFKIEGLVAICHAFYIFIFLFTVHTFTIHTIIHS